MAATFENSAGNLATTNVGSLADRVRNRNDLQPLATHVLQALRSAFATRDVEFPRPSCRTLAGQTFLSGNSEPDTIDEFAALMTQLMNRGASSQEELDCFSELASSGVMGALQRDPTGAATLARQVLWLECCSQLPILTYVSQEPKHEAIRALAGALSALLRTSDVPPVLSRGEQWTALAWLQSANADVGNSLDGELLSAVSPPIPLRSFHAGIMAAANARTLSGRLAIAPKGSVSTAISAFSGWLLFRQLVDWTLRLFLGYRANAEVTLSEQGLEIRESRSLLGRKLREQTTVLSMQQIKHLRREVRFSRAGTYAGLAALGFGSVLGMRLFVDGLRVPGSSLPLLLLGLLVVLGGLGLDFLLTNWLDASKSRCRFLVIAEGGAGLCLAGVEPARADAILSELSSRLRNAS